MTTIELALALGGVAIIGYFAWSRSKQKPAVLRLSATSERSGSISELRNLTMIIFDNEQVVLAVTPVTAAGNRATVDGNVGWGSSDNSVATVTVNESNSFEAMVRATGKVGSAQILASVDADLSEGTRELVGYFDIEVVGGEAVSLGFTASGRGPIPSDEPINGSEPADKSA